MNAIFDILLRSNFRCGRMFYSRAHSRFGCKGCTIDADI